MNANKRPLNRTGQIGLLVLVGSMTVAVFSGGSVAFITVLSGILGFYLLTHQDLSLKKVPSTGGPKK